MSDSNGSTVRRACLGMPGYGDQTAGAARGLWRASALRQARIPIDLSIQYQEGSLLAQNFNGLWCWALNEVHRGGRVDYFAMLHADVEPEDGWLDILIQELEEKDLDVLGAVVPIKCPAGLTSIALEREDEDPWRPLCRLTMHEVYRLPATFTQADVGHPLLLNTGCWVCRFDADWVKRIHFTVNDRIVYCQPRDMYIAQVEPEDWHVSRKFNKLGLRIGATRKVKLDHAGKHRFTNQQPWGAEFFDSDYVPASVIPDNATNGFRFPHDVDGWLLPEEGAALAELARGKRVLEIGSYCGKSAICLAQTAEKVYSLDPFDGRGTPRPRDTSKDWADSLSRYGVLGKCAQRAGTTAERGPGLVESGQRYGLIFIDGAHDLESVRTDIKYAAQLLEPDGLLVFHDYRRHSGQHDGRWDPGVTEAVDELLSAGGELISTHATLAVVRPPAGILLEV